MVWINGRGELSHKPLKTAGFLESASMSMDVSCGQWRGEQRERGEEDRNMYRESQCRAVSS